ncbi:MAG: DUF1553 domain-containing protein [Bacteroidota bacterium]
MNKTQVKIMVHFVRQCLSIQSILLLWIGLLTLQLVGCGTNKPQEVVEAEKKLPDVIDFNFHVKPILSDRCYACHGPDKENQKADLRLDTPKAAFAALASGDGHAIVPGKLGKSEVYHRIVSDDPEVIMPPPESHLQLTAEDKAIITKWIEQGAEYKPHWAFIKPEKPESPTTENKKWSSSPIDNFVLARLEREGLTPSKEADKETLIRRLSFDLTGLPPTLAEIDQFLDDKSPDAYEKLVDRLLQSPAYGERMAANWMDAARYADSDGYLDDKHRNFSPWRDWVIKAFNENMPYDQFATWQLAGDLIPNPTQESILATAFNRLHKKNSEAGIVFEEYRQEYVADRVGTLGQVFMGLSLECARCHDHKYDPISQKDFYEVSGFFNSTREIGTPVYGPDQTPGPSLLLSSEEQENIIQFVSQKIENLEKKLEQHKKSPSDQYKNWKASTELTGPRLKQQLNQNLVAHYPFDQIQPDDDVFTSPNLVDGRKPATLKEPIIKEGKKGNAFFVSDYNSVELGEKVGWYERTEPFSVSLWLYPDTVYQEVGVFYHCENLRLGYKGYSLHLTDNRLQFIMAHSWPYNSIQLTSQEVLPAKEWSQVTITYDGSSQADGVHIYVNGQLVSVSIDHDNLYKGILYEPDIHTYGFDGFTLGQRVHIIPFKNGGIDEIKVYNRALTGLEVLYSYSPTSATKSLSQESPLLQEYYWAQLDAQTKTLRDSLNYHRDKINTVLNEIPEIMVMGDLEEPRPTYILDRGLYDARTEEVEPGIPEAVLEYDDNLPKNRLGLTKWLFDEENPLTARVYVNRIWQMHFGQGLVKSSEDFGNQGDLPSHPELLDWLAVTFIESGWDIKVLHKQIVMSATYRQSSVVTPRLAETDKENVLLARGPRFRLPAEMIRDNALAVSGLLVDKVGGSSVYPYQPAGLWDELSNKGWRYQYLQEPGDGLYRRSLYTIWKRTAPPPSMLIFDAPERGICTVRRRTTSTPLQALVLLNDPQYLEASRVLAERLIKENQQDSTRQLEQAFRLIIGRSPDEQEMSILTEFYQKEVNRFKDDPQDAQAYLSIGEYERNQSLPTVQVAALATVSNAIMNTNEAYTRQ